MIHAHVGLAVDGARLNTRSRAARLAALMTALLALAFAVAGGRATSSDAATITGKDDIARMPAFRHGSTVTASTEGICGSMSGTQMTKAKYTDPLPSSIMYQSGSSFPHIIVIGLHNLNYSDVFGANSRMRYLSSLASSCAYAAHYTAAFSSGNLRNELAYVAGAQINLADSTTATFNNLPNQVSIANIVKPKFWKSARYYMEDMAKPCGLSASGGYAPYNNAPAYMPLSKCEHVAPTGNQYDAQMGTQTSGQMQSDLEGSPAAFSYIEPNSNHNGTGGPAAADAWLAQWIPFITTTATYRSGTEAIFIVSDHGSGGNGSSCPDMSTNPGCHVPLVVLDPHISPGTVDIHCYNHFSLMKTWSDIWGVKPLGHGRDPATEEMYTNMHL